MTFARAFTNVNLTSSTTNSDSANKQKIDEKAEVNGRVFEKISLEEVKDPAAFKAMVLDINDYLQGYRLYPKASFKEIFNWMCYRVWNAIKSIFGQSDFQIVTKTLVDKFKTHSKEAEETVRKYVKGPFIGIPKLSTIENAVKNFLLFSLDENWVSKDNNIPLVDAEFDLGKLIYINMFNELLDSKTKEENRLKKQQATEIKALENDSTKSQESKSFLKQKMEQRHELASLHLENIYSLKKEQYEELLNIPSRLEIAQKEINATEEEIKGIEEQLKEQVLGAQSTLNQRLDFLKECRKEMIEKMETLGQVEQRHKQEVQNLKEAKLKEMHEEEIKHLEEFQRWESNRQDLQEGDFIKFKESHKKDQEQLEKKHAQQLDVLQKSFVAKPT